MNDNIKVIKNNIQFGLIAKLLQILFPVIVRRVIVFNLGMQCAGLGSLFNNIFSILNIAELGIGGALTYMLYRPIFDLNYSLINSILLLYKKCYFYIGLFIFTIGMAIMPFLGYLINGDYPSDINIYIIYIINLLSIVIPYWVYAYYVSLISAYRREDILLKINIIMYGIQTILQIISIVYFKNFYLFMIIVPIISIIANSFVGITAKKYFPKAKPEGMLHDQIRIDLKKRVSGAVYYKIGKTFLFSTDSMVISTKLGLVAVALYNNYYIIISAVIGGFEMIANAIRAVVGRWVVSEDTDSNKMHFFLINHIMNAVLGVCTIDLLVAFQPVIKFWLGKDALLNETTMILFVVYFYLCKCNFTIELYKDSLGMWRKDCVRPLAIGIINLLLNILVVEKYNYVGILVASVLVMIVISVPWEIRVFFNNYLYDEKNKFIRRQLESGCIVAIFAFASYIVSHRYLRNLPLICLFLLCVVMDLIYIVIYICIFWKTEETKEFLKNVKYYLIKRKG